MKNLLTFCKQYTVIVFGALISFSAVSADAEQDKNSAMKLANDFLTVCFEDAKEDEVADQDLIDYLAICVNDELESSDESSMSYEQVVQLIKQSKLIKLPKV